ncbi:MAG: hypothetical protein JNL81_00745 [Hyphomonadaceae bacterium]|nr:hypothetical protein [Hyphomonadaceae bacterium]
MRLLMLALALPLMLAACDASVSSNGEQLADATGGYTLEVRAVEGVQTYIVVAPDGRRTAGRAAEGASALLDEEAIQGLGDMQPLNTEPQPEVFALRLPGVDISVAADADNPNSESASVRVNAGGRSVHVDADEGAPGDSDDRANVRITGATEEDARDFINDAEEISAEVKTQMLAAVGL